ncbi:MAG: PIN domain-containing protein [Dehalococcoidia bacterium]|nr:PIN domain-containing protein [Dehalococcoidia bacterium]
MTEYLLDTTEIIDYGRGHPPTVTLLNNLYEQGNSLGYCDVVIAEVYAGVKQKDRGNIEDLVEALRFYPSDKGIARTAGQYINDFSQQGTRLTVADALIAAVAISYRLVIITKNQKHYPMPELNLYQF